MQVLLFIKNTLAQSTSLMQTADCSDCEFWIDLIQQSGASQTRSVFKRKMAFRLNVIEIVFGSSNRGIIQPVFKGFSSANALMDSSQYRTGIARSKVQLSLEGKGTLKSER